MKKHDITAKTPIFALAATASLALAACGGGASNTNSAQTQPAEVTVAATTASTPGSQATAAENTQQNTQAPTEQQATTAAQPAETTQQEQPATGATTQTANAVGEAIENPCEGVCKEIETLNVNHPNLGPVQIVTYQGEDLKPGSAPGEFLVSYALMKDGKTLGWAQSKEGALSLTSRPSLGGPDYWKVPDGVNTDKYGNVYLSSGGPYDIVILTPTENGYDARGTLPGGEDQRFRNVELTIDETGEPTLRAQSPQGVTATYVFNGTEFVES